MNKPWRMARQGEGAVAEWSKADDLQSSGV